MLGLVTPFIKKTVADSLAVNVSKAMLGRTGPQFMMEDRDHEQWTRKDALASLNGNSAASVVSKSSTELGVNSNESSGKAPLLARLAFDVAGEASYYGALKVLSFCANCLIPHLHHPLIAHLEHLLLNVVRIQKMLSMLAGHLET